MLVTSLGTLVLAGFVRYAVISKVPTTLHTPLMSGTNAIHGIVVLGGILLLATGAATGTFDKVLAVGRRGDRDAPAPDRLELGADPARRRARHPDRPAVGPARADDGDARRWWRSSTASAAAPSR